MSGQKTIGARSGSRIEGPPATQVDALYLKTPMQAELNRQLNAVERIAPADLSRHERAVRSRLEAFEDSDGDGHPNGAWVIEMMRGCVAGTFGDTAELLQCSLRALPLATTFWQRASTLGNLSEAYRHAGRKQDAVEAAVRAVQLDPRHEGFWVDLSLSLLAAGRHTDTDDVLIGASRRFDLRHHRGVFASALRTYPMFREARKSVPTLGRLVGSADGGAA
jgi:hypothetical protein